MNYREAIDWLYGTQLFGIKLGLANVRRLFEELDLFQAIEGRKVIHVAGTNGKGSVCAMIDSILRENGRKPGLFTSPHLVTFRERIRVGGEMISEAAAAELLTEIRTRIESRDPHPTFFEIVTALAVWHFCRSEADVLVMETGMGGRLDSTNVVPSDVSVITPIALDHQQALGSSLAEIAVAKAGIIKPGVPVVVAPQTPEAESVIREAADEQGSKIVRPDVELLEGWAIGLAGEHQRINAASAVAAVTESGLETESGILRKGVEKVTWPARFQPVGDRIIIDGAHNEAAAQALVETWQQRFGDDPATIVFGGVSNKKTADILRRLSSIAKRFVWVKVQSKRGLSTGDLEVIWEYAGDSETDCHQSTGLADAISHGESFDERILITGSLYLAGEALAELENSAPFEVSEQ